MGVEGLGGLEMETDEDETVCGLREHFLLAHGIVGLGGSNSLLRILARPR